MKTSLRCSLVVLLAVMALAPPASAQTCAIGDDGFDTGCCNFATSNLPNLPAITMQANWARLVGCGAQSQQLVTVSLTAPFYPYCDYALINVFVQFPGGETISGLLAAKYVRTFLQIPAPTGQIWRFLVNGDLTCSMATGTNACTTPLPRCASIPGQLVHFDGHIDYRCDQTTASGGITASMSLSHHQGCFTHASWSCMPISGPLGHPEASWHLVGPSPFVFGIAPTPQGPLVADAVRTSILRIFPTFFYACQSESKVGPGGILAPGASSCLCASFNSCTNTPVPCTSATACYVDQSLSYITCCPTGTVAGPFNSVPVTGTPIANTGMVALRLGTWGSLPQYPSGVSLSQYLGVVTYTTPTGCIPPNWNIHVAVGVGTQGALAMPFTQVVACLPPSPICLGFVDLANVLPLNSSSSLNPGYGCLAASDVVWSFNTP